MSIDFKSLSTFSLDTLYKLVSIFLKNSQAYTKRDDFWRFLKSFQNFHKITDIVIKEITGYAVPAYIKNTSKTNTEHFGMYNERDFRRLLNSYYIFYLGIRPTEFTFTNVSRRTYLKSRPKNSDTLFSAKIFYT